MKKQKIHIKHLFAYLGRKGVGTIDLAILTNSNQYIEYSLEFRQKCMTMWVARRIRSLFEPYLIDASTDVVVNSALDEQHPLYQYFMLLRQHIGFRLASVEKKKIINRIYHYLAGKSTRRTSMKKTWELSINKRICPWITQDIEYKIQNKGPKLAERIRSLRLGLFYIVVKNHLYRPTKCNKQDSTYV